MITNTAQPARSEQFRSGPGPWTDGPRPTAGRGDPAGGMGMQRPNTHTVVVWATGELDMQRATHWAELVAPRLTSTVTTLVLDLSEVTFFGVDALNTLLTAQQHAHARGISLRLVTGTTAVQRALHAANATRHLAIYHSRAGAVAAEASPTIAPSPIPDATLRRDHRKDVGS